MKKYYTSYESLFSIAIGIELILGSSYIPIDKLFKFTHKVLIVFSVSLLSRVTSIPAEILASL